MGGSAGAVELVAAGATEAGEAAGVAAAGAVSAAEVVAAGAAGEDASRELEGVKEGES